MKTIVTRAAWSKVLRYSREIYKARHMSDEPFEARFPFARDGWLWIGEGAVEQGNLPASTANAGTRGEGASRMREEWIETVRTGRCVPLAIDRERKLSWTPTSKELPTSTYTVFVPAEGHHPSPRMTWVVVADELMPLLARCTSFCAVSDDELSVVLGLADGRVAVAVMPARVGVGIQILRASPV